MKQYKFTILQFCRSDVWHVSLSYTHQDCILFWRLKGRISFLLTQVVGRIQLPVAVELSLLCCPCKLRHSLRLEDTHTPWFVAPLLCLQSQQWWVESFSFFKSPPFSSITSLWLSQEIFFAFKDTCGPIQIIQDKANIWRSVTLTTLAKSLLPCVVTYSQILGINAAHLWGDRRRSIKQPTTNCSHLVAVPREKQDKLHQCGGNGKR